MTAMQLVALVSHEWDVLLALFCGGGFGLAFALGTQRMNGFVAVTLFLLDPSRRLRPGCSSTPIRVVQTIVLANGLGLSPPLCDLRMVGWTYYGRDRRIRHQATFPSVANPRPLPVNINRTEAFPAARSRRGQ
jgi:hypothetical protein